ncbi:hypothetical protein LEP1GSC061_0278 [Leptospira wolffii serovar Khorat str. Khorat-H2]|nr:hypothetical protein LEP1GSC061_0278 [Leptospira wolffii serovar Khorat str. Khorat-H2]
MRFSLSKNLTNLHFLGLAVSHSCKFVSFDAGIPWAQIVGGGKFLKIIDPVSILQDHLEFMKSAKIRFQEGASFRRTGKYFISEL